MQQNSEVLFFTTRQVMERYHISPATLWRWANDPALSFPPPLKIGNKKLYALKAIEAWEAAQMGAAS